MSVFPPKLICGFSVIPIEIPTKFFIFESESRSVMSDSLPPYGLYSLWNSPGQNTGMGSLSLLQEIFPTQGSSPGLPHCRWILYQLRHKGSQRILEWVAYPFSRGSSWLRNQTGVSCIAGRFFTNWAIWEACPPPFLNFIFRNWQVYSKNLYGDRTV